MKTIRIVSLLIGFGLAAAGCAAVADDSLQIAGKEVGEDGVLTRRLAEVVGDTAPTTTPILAIDNPHVAGSVYQITGTVEYSDIQGEGYLEMGSTFPDGEQVFTRTLDPTGALGKFSGSSGPRPFALPIQLVAGAPAPTRLVLNVVLQGPGDVKLSDLRLSGGTAITAVPGAWWSSRAAGASGGAAIGVIGATIGVLCALGRYRRFAEALLTALLGLGVGGLVTGGAAVALGQPREVWFPLLLMGLLAALLPSALRREVRRRFARAEFSGFRA
ncbi:MAG TPA: hypothetical protein VKM54_16375 [Myxococcota bacterium]|nr:hypothetical protein [Myxococcota bacterium]